MKAKTMDFFNSLVSSRRNKIILGVSILVLALLITITLSANIIYDHEIPSVEIASSDWNENENLRGPGSWHIDKSAEWTGLNKAQIKFKLDTTPKYTIEEIENFDVILTLDISTSMKGEKIEKLKESANKYIDYILKDSNNRVAIANYQATGNVLSGFTNDKSSLHNIVNSLQLKCDGETLAGGGKYCTNYYEGLVKTGEILKDYNATKERQLIVIFLTDGNANKDNSLMRGEYELLKEKFPKMVIVGVQYEMGKEINYWLKQISEIQLDAYIDDIYDKLFEATIEAQREYLEKYEKFEIVDYMTKDFYVNSVNDIKVSKGSVELTEENGLQKIVWSLSGENIDSDFLSGASATMTINAISKIQSKTIGFYPTNEKEVIKNKLETDKEEEIDESPKTPVLQNLFNVIYDPNLPSDCKSTYVIETKLYAPFQVVPKSNGELKCDGFVFKGWEYDESTDDFKKVSDETFEMPKHDVKIKGVWGTLDITKKMEGTVYVRKRELLYDVVKKGAVSDRSINFRLYSSDSNGKGHYVYEGTQNNTYPIYYYRGAVTDNNIIYAGFCWKMVRTTETGGIKLIYNGKPSSTYTCNNTGTNSGISLSKFNSSIDNVKYMGYMYDTTTSSVVKGIIDSWYKINIEDKGYSSYLEDTIWCADRNGTATYGTFVYYGFGKRSFINKTKPIITCPLQVDSYTVKSTTSNYNSNLKGNRLLDYPIALITGDEAQLAGYAWSVDNKVNNAETYNTSTYLHINQSFWVLSPDAWYSNNSVAMNIGVTNKGAFSNYHVDSGLSVRPSVSLKVGTLVTPVGNNGAEGSAENPYYIFEE